MKKLLLICLAFVLLLSAVSCAQQFGDFELNTSANHINAETPYVTGTVSEVLDKKILIEGGTEVYPQGAKIYVSLDTEVKTGTMNFSVGDEVIVYYDGMIQEVSPAIIPTVYQIVLKDSANTTIPGTVMENLREPNAAVTSQAIKPGEEIPTPSTTPQTKTPIEGTVTAVTQTTTAPTADPTVTIQGEGQGEHHVTLNLHSQSQNIVYLSLTADYDAKLLTYNWWYLLEYYQDGKWVTLRSREQAAPYLNNVISTICYDTPIPDLPLTSRTYCDLSLLSDVTLQSGRYRITQMFNDEEYTVECDLVFDPPLVIPKQSDRILIPE